MTPLPTDPESSNLLIGALALVGSTIAALFKWAFGRQVSRIDTLEVKSHGCVSYDKLDKTITHFEETITRLHQDTKADLRKLDERLYEHITKDD